MRKREGHISIRDRLYAVAVQTQLAYRFTNASALADFIITRMPNTFGRWWAKASPQQRRSTLAQFDRIIKGGE